MSLIKLLYFCWKNSVMICRILEGLKINCYVFKLTNYAHYKLSLKRGITENYISRENDHILCAYSHFYCGICHQVKTKDCHRENFFTFSNARRVKLNFFCST